MEVGDVDGVSADGLRVHALSSIEDVYETWTGLAQASGNVFSTPDWALAWWHHYGAGRTLHIVRVSDRTGRDVAVLPLQIERHRGVDITRFLGHGVADQLGPVCDPFDVMIVAGALRDASTGRVFLAERLSGQRDWRALGGQVIHEDMSPVIQLSRERGWNDYLAARSANFRQQARRRVRRLRGALDLRYRLADSATLHADLEALIALHNARWNGRSHAFAGARPAFHHEFAEMALERGWLRLWMAEARGRRVAGWYGFRFAGVDSFYQLGWDTTYARFGLGAAILEHSIREAFADGMRDYRLLRGDEPYKRRYATTDESVQTIAVGHGPLGPMVVAVVGAVARVTIGRKLLKAIGS